MARLLIACMEQAGHRVRVASELRVFLRDAQDVAVWADLQAAARVQSAQIAQGWRSDGAPDLWFCYHPYYKAPDLLGPGLCRDFGLPYVTVETSYSARRNAGVWAQSQAAVLAGIKAAAVNIGMTERDRAGVRAAAPAAVVAGLRPFIDESGFARVRPAPEPGHLVCVAMMRAGDKFDSYARLAAGLARIAHLPWVLSIIGDGPLQAEVRALFADFDAGRVRWLGRLGAGEIAAVFARAQAYVWPGCGEAYGLAYLEAQAAALPVVAYATAGVPEVVEDDETGILTAPGDDAAYGAAIGRLLSDAAMRGRMAARARSALQGPHSMAAAVLALDAMLQKALRPLAQGAP
ncbi:MAG: glycosyltransferase family 4 protein [Paracoccaceae bacterium]|nr:glycosyltransferase family 4 protein [Paracoccaceae bacterium]